MCDRVSVLYSLSLRLRTLPLSERGVPRAPQQSKIAQQQSSVIYICMYICAPASAHTLSLYILRTTTLYSSHLSDTPAVRGFIINSPESPRGRNTHTYTHTHSLPPGATTSTRRGVCSVYSLCCTALSLSLCSAAAAAAAAAVSRATHSVSVGRRRRRLGVRERESENGKCLSEPPRSLSLSAHAPKTWRADDAVASKRLDVCVCVCVWRERYTRALTCC